MPNLVFTNQPGHWFTNDFPRVHLTRVSWDTAPHEAIAYVFFGHVCIDFDGSPTAYAPPGHSPPGDDDLANAWDHKSGWFGVAHLKPTDAAVKSGAARIDIAPHLNKHGSYPVIQQAKNGDPNPGYYVSTTPQPMGPEYLQSSYIDASQISFGALSGKFASLGVNLGDYGLAIRHDRSLQSGFYFADRGGNTHALGECSHKVGKDLGGTGRASHFNNNFPVSMIVFPDSFTVDPKGVPSIPDDDIKANLAPLLRPLSQAGNFDDLPLLMGFNEVRPSAIPHGLTRLEHYHKHPDLPRPANYNTVLQGLKAFGWAPSFPTP